MGDREEKDRKKKQSKYEPGKERIKWRKQVQNADNMWCS